MHVKRKHTIWREKTQTIMHEVLSLFKQSKKKKRKKKDLESIEIWPEPFRSTCRLKFANRTKATKINLRSSTRAGTRPSENGIPHYNVWLPEAVFNNPCSSYLKMLIRIQFNVHANLLSQTKKKKWNKREKSDRHFVWRKVFFFVFLFRKENSKNPLPVLIAMPQTPSATQIFETSLKPSRNFICPVEKL